MRTSIRNLLDKPCTRLRAPRHIRKLCKREGCPICEDINRKYPLGALPKLKPYCSCGACNFCRETERIERIFNARFGAEMEYYYDGLINRANTFKAIERAYYYCLSCD